MGGKREIMDWGRKQREGGEVVDKIKRERKGNEGYFSIREGGGREE